MTGEPREQTPQGDAGDRPGPETPAPAAARGTISGRRDGARPGLDLGWGKILALMAWGFVVLAFAAGGLADVTGLWWLVLVFGVAVPVLFVALQNRTFRAGRGLPPEQGGERELLDVLRERGEVTAATAAMLTTLTVDGASGILEGLARKGHLEALTRDGTLVYALRERDRRSLDGPAPQPGVAASPAGERGPQPLAEPLSGREREVLGLMALGRTNAEISRELFVAVGTVKAHANNIYRKLGANNRSEAVSKASDLGLLR
ncbi:MAG: Two-component transcriptional response regulator, LuxR family [uncultured Rubrobacteraceae bacterium]|uniref:Two-component transcriptional response regulator, LuxR family n=1 Tax=uncultured Rubrobacteraceae bacterium TaxID=349277 RepID=A0A6J4NJ50_9ACTN|nr:MAG: Two-component transcriptional response regulator, LuxR family [uncultured Rubrobacteraceae bacterium]